MPQRSHGATTTARSGLQATVPLYLADVTVDDAGFITDYRIAFLPPDADPDRGNARPPQRRSAGRRTTRPRSRATQPQALRAPELDRTLLGHLTYTHTGHPTRKDPTCPNAHLSARYESS